MTDQTASIVIAGAGSIGCYVGGCLALAGAKVTFLARPRIVAGMSQLGLRITDLEGRDRLLKAEQIVATEDAAQALPNASIVLVTVKSGATVEMAQAIDRFAPKDAIIVSLQNGVENAARIKAAQTTPRNVVAGMVPFNVVLSENDGQPVRAHRATEGNILIEATLPDLAERISAEGLTVEAHADMKAVLWGKLLMNLNNALNALSGLPLAQELGDRRWRRLLARQMDEALAAMEANGIRPAKLAGAPPSLLPSILRLPNWLFGLVAKRMLAIDPEARSSTWEDLMRGRTTEIDEFQGAILRLAAAGGTTAPLTQRIIAEIRKAEDNGKGPPALDPVTFSN